MTKFKADINYNCRVYYKDGDVVNIFADKLPNTNTHQFKDWACDAGYSGIYVHSNGDVWSGECENDFLGNLNDNSFELLDSPGRCKRKFCTTNIGELSITKSKLE